MNRLELRQLAEDRILDAANLLAGQRWSGTYYLSGYAVECGLKACILAHVEKTGVIFLDKKFGETCWTHDLTALEPIRITLYVMKKRPVFCHFGSRNRVIRIGS